MYPGIFPFILSDFYNIFYIFCFHENLQLQ